MKDWTSEVNKIVGLGSKSVHKSYYPELKDKIDELNQQSVFYQSVLNCIPNSIVITDSDGVVRQVNPAFEELFGYKADEVLGQNISSIYSRQKSNFDKDFIWADSAKLFCKRNGEVFIGESQTTEITNDDGQLLAKLEVIKDLTENISSLNEHRELESRLHQAQKMESFGALAGGIAHDFNNILSGIIGFGEMIEHFNITDLDKINHNVNQMLTASYRARDLVKQILVFSRQDEEKLRHLQLRSVIEEVLQILRASLPSTIKIETEFEGCCDTILGDSTQLHQVLMNLCTNASHAMREKGGVLKITLSSIEITSQLMTDKVALRSYIKLELEDTGVGIAPEILDDIFEPYFTTKERTEGTGFGLALVDRIVQNHNGNIEVRSTPGVGTTFQLFFPYAEEKKQDTLGKIEGDEAAGTVRVDRGRILLVDDETLQINWCEDFLLHYGFTVNSFSSSVLALDSFVQDPEAYDIIITDQTMPNLTGTQMIRKVRGIRADIPVVLCTGLPNVLSAKELRQLNIENVLQKPIQLKELIAVVEKL